MIRNRLVSLRHDGRCDLSFVSILKISTPTANGISPAMFGRVKRQVGLLEHYLVTGGVELAARHTETGGHGVGLSEFGLNSVTDFFTNRRRLFHGHPREYYAEFLATVASDQPQILDSFADGPRDIAQHLVASGMPMVVIEFLEVVDVEHDAVDGLTILLETIPLRFQMLKQRSSVEAACQCVHGCQFLEPQVLLMNLLFGSLQFRQRLHQRLVLLL